MKLRLLLAIFLISLAGSSSVRADGDDDTQLGKEMSTMNRAFRLLKKQASDASQNAASIELVAKIKKGAEASIDLVPEKAADLPAADKAAFVASYKKEMNELVATLVKLETALKAGDNEAAVKIVAELGAMQKEGHKEFRTQKE